MYEPVILGIDPGARQIGVSVFRGDDLLFFGLKTIKARNPDEVLEKTRNIMIRLIDEYRGDYVAIEKIVFVQQQRSFVMSVYEEIIEVVRQRNIPLIEYDPSAIKTFICTNGKPTKQSAAQILGQKYGELAKYLNTSNVWQRRYAAGLFDAIAVGYVCAAKI
jgi:Holliday junction resolvasome RuvABC endonuclease subunit